jgi:hypothetical protein
MRFIVLKKNGTAIIMVYNLNSFRTFIQLPIRYFIHRLKGNIQDYSIFKKLQYDSDAEENPPPDTVFSSKKEIQGYFTRFSKLKIALENFDGFWIPKTSINIPRKLFLNNAAKFLGLDIYITARK